MSPVSCYLSLFYEELSNRRIAPSSLTVRLSTFVLRLTERLQQGRPTKEENMKNLVIVESPTKAKTISKFLGKDYDIKFSMGHIVDLPKSKLGVKVEHDFEPEMEIVPTKKNIISDLRKAATTADTIILATDPDREGEAIAANIHEILYPGKKGKDVFKRIVFHEITESAIKDALTHPRDIDTNLVNAQTARRVLDRLVGYKISPVLWQKVRRGLSAGRVQSVALRLIVEREREIEKFSKEGYFTIHALLKKPKGSDKSAVEFDLIEINGEKIEDAKKFTLYDGEYKITKTTITDEKKSAGDCDGFEVQTTPCRGCRAARNEAFTPAAFHHLDTPTRCSPPIRISREADDESGAKAIRGRIYYLSQNRLSDSRASSG